MKYMKTVLPVLLFTAATGFAWPSGRAEQSGGQRIYNIGDTGPAGGTVFYDKGSFSDGWRYMEVAPASADFRAEWGAYQKDVPGTDTSVGSGRRNTLLIVDYLNRAGEKDRAAQRCVALNINRFSDWFLPSKDELNLMYANLSGEGENFEEKSRRREILAGLRFNTDDGVCYLSSSQYFSDVAWVQSFSGGGMGTGSKRVTHSVRAVRAF